MPNRFTVRLEGEQKLTDFFARLSDSVNEARDATLSRAGEVARDVVQRNAPRSDTPRGPNKKNDRQNWRTGKHAADQVRVTKPFYDESGERAVEVGVPMDKKGRTPYFYLRVHEVGGDGGRIKARGFFARGREAAAAAIPDIALDELRQRIPK